MIVDAYKRNAITLDESPTKNTYVVKTMDLITGKETRLAENCSGFLRVGKYIYSKAAANGKRVQAQCEAKNHALVLEDADLESATNAIINSTYGCAGMRCMALPVIVVQESIADKFVALLKKKAEAMKVGCSYDPETKLGPVVSKAHQQKV